MAIMDNTSELPLNGGYATIKTYVSVLKDLELWKLRAEKYGKEIGKLGWKIHMQRQKIHQLENQLRAHSCVVTIEDVYKRVQAQGNTIDRLEDALDKNT